MAPQLVINRHRFREARLRAMLTQEELALRAVISVSHIAALESGRANARIATIRKLAEALQVEPLEISSVRYDVDGTATLASGE